MSHLGRRKAVPIPRIRSPVRSVRALLRQPVRRARLRGRGVEAQTRALKPGQVLLLENLRFHPEEEANEPAFADALARLGDVYVNDAFGTAHRAHASTVGVPERLRPAAAGFLMQKELEYLGGALAEPARPFAAIVGGAKISSKMPVLENLIAKCDRVLVGGAMMFTFLKAQGLGIGQSLVEDEFVPLAKDLVARAKADKVDVVLPVDARWSLSLDGDLPVTVHPSPLPEGLASTSTRDRIAVHRRARRLPRSWNGPMGIFEKAPFAHGTLRSRACSLRSRASATRSRSGGGDSAAALEKSGLADCVSHVRPAARR
jgi:phosphoglycerate kinase